TSPFPQPFSPRDSRGICAEGPGFPDRKGCAPTSGNGETLFSKRQHGERLISRDAGEPLDELINGGTGFEVFEQRSNRNASVPKAPCSAQCIRRALHGVA